MTPIVDENLNHPPPRTRMGAEAMAEVLTSELNALDQAGQESVLRIFRRQAQRPFTDTPTELYQWLEGMDEFNRSETFSLLQHIIASAPSLPR
jgi:hypothetical protein